MIFSSIDCFLKEQDLLVFDEPLVTKENQFEPFAYTDILIGYASETQHPIVHFWEMQNHIILGMKDTKVPFFSEGCQALKDLNYDLIIRNAGGLAVASDLGILNVSLIIPNNSQKKISISSAYQLMVDWIKATFKLTNGEIVAMEIKDSYCPGEFDLSINGKKFAGIAQRRIKNGIAVMIYLGINGPQTKRGEAIQAFYTQGLRNYEAYPDYPKISPSSMATLSNLMKKNWEIKDVKKELLRTLLMRDPQKIDHHKLKAYLLQPTIQHIFKETKNRMIKRNEALKEMNTI